MLLLGLDSDETLQLSYERQLQIDADADLALLFRLRGCYI